MKDNKIIKQIIPMLEANADYIINCKPRTRIIFTSKHSGSYEEREGDFYLGYEMAMKDAVRNIKKLIQYETTHHD